jgi:hypothetical protein
MRPHSIIIVVIYICCVIIITHPSSWLTTKQTGATMSNHKPALIPLTLDEGAIPTAEEVQHYGELKTHFIAVIKALYQGGSKLADAKNTALAQFGCKDMEDYFAKNGCKVVSKSGPNNPISFVYRTGV